MRAPLAPAALALGFVLAGGGAATAAKPRGKLTCKVTFQDGTSVKLPARRLRLLADEPVECTLTVTESDPAYLARVQTHWKEVDDRGKLVARDGDEHSGAVDIGTPLVARLLAEKDYSACTSFTIDARILDEKGKASWKKTLKVKLFCDD